MDSSPSSTSGSLRASPLDLMAAIIRGKADPSNSSAESAANELASIILENRELVMVLTTSIAVLIGCVVVLVWRRSGGRKPRGFEPPKPPAVEKEPEPEVDDGKKRVTIFFGTQTGTAEGFAKVRVSV